jgi:tetratricopeptide (TPR) repeat protein
MIHEEQGHLGLAIREIEAGVKILKMDDPGFPWWDRAYYVLLLAANGKIAEAEANVRALKKESVEYRNIEYLYWRAAGTLALGKSNLQSARNDFEMGEERFFWGNYFLGRTYLQLGLLDKAAAILEKALSRYDMSRARVPILAVKAYYLLGMVYEKSGWKNKAIEKFEEFLDIWKNADPGLPEVADAKQRLSKLKKL